MVLHKRLRAVTLAILVGFILAAAVPASAGFGRFIRPILEAEMRLRNSARGLRQIFGTGKGGCASRNPDNAMRDRYGFADEAFLAVLQAL